jgi:CYTH domain-containing protein
MGRPEKYARRELERRFLLAGVPPAADEQSGRRIHDRYVIGTRLRLRRVEPLLGGPTEYKLGQKETPNPNRLSYMRHTSIYLTPDEYDILASLPAHVLEKRRYTLVDSGHRYGINVFDGLLKGLVLAEIGAESETELTSCPVPEFAVAEVSDDIRFTGGALAATTAGEAATLLSYASGDPSARPSTETSG